MKLFIGILFTALSLAPAVAASELRGGARALTAPDPKGSKIKKCILVNLKTLDELVLDGSDEYDFTQAGGAGWSVKCFSEVGKSLNYVKFFYDGTTGTQYYSSERFASPDLQPFWMRGDNRGARVNAVPYLNSNGAKEFTVKFHTWQGGDEFPSDRMTYVLNPISKCAGVTCPLNSACDEATGACRCNVGLKLNGEGVCVPINKCAGVLCPADSTCDSATGACRCDAGLVLKDGVCAPIDKCAGVQCPADSTCDSATGACRCNAGLVLKDGVCAPIDKCAGVQCPTNSTCDSATGDCRCNAGLVLKDGVCAPIDKCAGVQCPVGSSCDGNTGACVCSNPNNVLVNGACKCNLQKSYLVGFKHGNAFDHTLEIGECPLVSQASFQTSTHVDRVGFLLSDGKWLDDGGNGGVYRGLQMGHGEYVKQVKVCKDPSKDGVGALAYIQYTTNKLQTVAGGFFNGNCQYFDAPDGKAIVGFHGSSTYLIHSLGVIYGPRPVIKASGTDP